MVLSNLKRGRNVEIFLWIIILVEIVGFISSYLQYDLIVMAQDGLGISQSTADSNDIRELIITRVFAVTYIIAVVLFIMWFRRAYNNLNRMGVDTDYREGWAAGAWFVPFLNLYRPYQIMKELYEKTYQKFQGRNNNFDVLRDINLVAMWWTLWILNNIIGQISSKISRSAETLEQLINATTVHMIYYVVGIISAFATVKVIRNYSAIEPLLVDMNDAEIVADEIEEADSYQPNKIYLK
ncbi:MAG: hypothetical protein ACI8P7_000131 [Candidatus Azotimanducaceae bacterium]|jgi:hypothetical protein